MKTQKLLSIFCLCLLITFIVPIVNAETLTGTLETSGVTTSNINYPYIAGAAPVAVTTIQINHSESFVLLTTALVHTDLLGYHSLYYGSAPASEVLPVWYCDDSSNLIASGTFGYQRYFNFLGIEQEGYQWYVFNSWYLANASTKSGNIKLTARKNVNCGVFPSMNISSFGARAGSSAYSFPGWGNAQFGAAEYPAGLITQNSEEIAKSYYTVTKPQGLGIQGWVNKTVGGTTYNSKIYVTNSQTGVPIASDLIINNINLPLNTIAESIIISMNTPRNTWVNSSVLFVSAIPTVTPTPGADIETNITVTAQSTIGNTPLTGANVELFYHNQVYSSYSGVTNSSGIIILNNVQHYENEEMDLRVSKSGYQTWFNTFNIPNVANYPVLAKLIPVYMPTPTAAPYDQIYLEVYPTAINLGEHADLLLSSSNASKISDAKTVLYYENKNLGAYSSYNLIGVFRYNTSGANWDFRENNLLPWDFTPHDPSTFEVTPTSTGEYTYQVAVFGANSVSWGSATTNLLIGGSSGGDSNLIMTLFAIDGSTTSHLQNYTLILTEDVGGISHTYNVGYDVEVSLQRGGIFTLEGQKEGYITNTISFVVPQNLNIMHGDMGSYVNVPLFNAQDVPTAGNTTVVVHVDDKETYFPISNVQVSMTGLLTPKFTGTSGESVSFILSQNTQFTTTATKSGYCSVSETKNTSTQTYMYVDLYMKFGACLGVAPTHTPIPNATSFIPAPTLIGGYGNLNGTATICQQNLSANASLIDRYIKNPIACAGITDIGSQNMVLALLIILVIGIISAKFAGAIGFAIGCVIGCLVALMLGLIPLWFIVILVLISIAVLSIKIFFSNAG